MRTFLAVACCAALAQPAFAATDISGIKTGVSLASQRALIAKVNPKYQLTNITDLSGKVVGLQAVVNNGGLVSDGMLVLQDSTGTVWFVGRKQVLAEGSRMTTDVLLKSLSEKYGTLNRAVPNTYLWQFDRSGKLHLDNKPTGPCVTRQQIDYDWVGNTGILVPRQFVASCGMMISATPLGTGDMVDSFTVTILDSKRIFDDLNGKAQDAATQKQKALDAEKAKNNKPVL